jgi:uncharacterized membrane protein
VEELHAAGIPREEISLIIRETRREIETQTDSGPSSTAAGIVAGGALGGLGGLLVGLTALAIPGIGPVLAAGPLLATLGGVAVGAATGGLFGALVSQGVPEEHAHRYVTEIEGGSALLMVRTDTAMQARALQIMIAAGATNVTASTVPVAA